MARIRDLPQRKVNQTVNDSKFTHTKQQPKFLYEESMFFYILSLQSYAMSYYSFIWEEVTHFFHSPLDTRSYLFLNMEENVKRAPDLKKRKDDTPGVSFGFQITVLSILHEGMAVFCPSLLPKLLSQSLFLRMKR